MVAIVDAYDAMTTDHVYRRAMPKERAVAELYACAGSQFDPELVAEFAELVSCEQINLHRMLAKRWLSELTSEQADQFWGLGLADGAADGIEEGNRLFYQSILDNIHDGVIFIDSDLVVQLWNRPAERMTGIVAGAIVGRQWSPSLLHMRDESQALIGDDDCPVVETLRSGVQSLRRLAIRGSRGDATSVDVHFIPVIGNEGRRYGVTIVVHDTSHQVTLEQRLEALQQRATRDPLTQVANRAEFDRMLAKYVQTHLGSHKPCSLIICDIDHFKSINDTFGHQAGDDALISFATILRRFARTGDFVARYGGEEFVILCADCNCDTAARRAEKLRRDVEATSQPSLKGRALTASFGVTELQPGDTPETMLRRADRALLQAKESGRNMVVQLGAGGMEAEEAKESVLKRWRNWFQADGGPEIVRTRLATNVPLTIVAEKLKGFIADHYAEIMLFEDNRVALQVSCGRVSGLRRQADRSAVFHIGLTFTDWKEPSGMNRGTIIDVLIRPRRNRDRRQKAVRERARQLMQSLKAYLMATEVGE